MPARVFKRGTRRDTASCEVETEDFGKNPKLFAALFDESEDSRGDETVRHSSCPRVANQYLTEGTRIAMWNLFNCYLSGRHDYSAWCEPGAIFLRCVHCGRRSTGWTVNAKEHAPVHAQATVPSTARKHVLPFSRAAAR